MQKLPPEVLDRFKEQFDCWNRGELDLMLEMYAENAVFDVSAVFTDVAPMEGHRDIRRYWGTLRETWEGIRVDPLEAFDVGEGRLVVDQRMWATGQRSGIEVDQRFAMLYTVRPEDGKFTHAQLLPDVATAISAAERVTPPEASASPTFPAGEGADLTRQVHTQLPRLRR